MDSSCCSHRIRKPPPVYIRLWYLKLPLVDRPVGFTSPSGITTVNKDILIQVIPLMSVSWLFSSLSKLLDHIYVCQNFEICTQTSRPIFVLFYSENKKTKLWTRCGCIELKMLFFSSSICTNTYLIYIPLRIIMHGCIMVCHTITEHIEYICVQLLSAANLIRRLFLGKYKFILTPVFVGASSDGAWSGLRHSTRQPGQARSIDYKFHFIPKINLSEKTNIILSIPLARYWQGFDVRRTVRCTLVRVHLYSMWVLYVCVLCKRCICTKYNLYGIKDEIMRRLTDDRRPIDICVIL